MRYDAAVKNGEIVVPEEKAEVTTPEAKKKKKAPTEDQCGNQEGHMWNRLD